MKKILKTDFPAATEAAQKRVTIYYLVSAVTLYALWSGIVLIMPGHYYDQPAERLLLSLIGGILAVYMLSPRAPSMHRCTLLLTFYLILVHFHFLSLFVRAGADEIYALGLLIFLAAASLLFVEMWQYISFFMITLVSYSIAFIALNLPSHRVIMLIAGMITIGLANTLLTHMRINMSNQFHAQQLQIAKLEHKLIEEKLLKQEEETEHYKNAAYHDALTGLASRVSFDRLIKHRLASADHGHDPFTLLFLDLDDFKTVNDLHGHAAGDLVLKQFATRLKSALRSADYAARYAGDEFTCILIGIDSMAEAKPICERILKVSADPYRLASGLNCSLSVSIGMVFYPGNEPLTHEKAIDEPQDLMQRADKALYEAKRLGKNRWVLYSSAME